MDPSLGCWNSFYLHDTSARFAPSWAADRCWPVMHHSSAKAGHVIKPRGSPKQVQARFPTNPCGHPQPMAIHVQHKLNLQKGGYMSWHICEPECFASGRGKSRVCSVPLFLLSCGGEDFRRPQKKASERDHVSLGFHLPPS